MSDRTRFQYNADFREAMRRSINRIESLEMQLQQIEPFASPPELLDYYVRLGDAYRELFDLNTLDTRTTIRLDTEKTQPFRNTSSFLPTSRTPEQNTPLGQILEIANTYYKQASAMLKKTPYPENRYNTDKKRIANASKATKQAIKLGRSNIDKQLKITQRTIRDSEPPYNGFWVQSVAYHVPLTLSIILIILISGSLYFHIPISVTLHIPPYDCEPGSITINGSTTLMPLVKIASSEYHTLCSGTGATIIINPPSLASGSDNGLSQLLEVNGPLNIATSNSFADTTTSQLQEHPVAIAVYVLAVNKDVNQLQEPDLSSSQIAAIYSGSYSTWSAVECTGQKLEFRGYHLDKPSFYISIAINIRAICFRGAGNCSGCLILLVIQMKT